MPKTVSRSRCPSRVSGSGGARVGEMGATGGGEGKGSALPHTVMSHSTQPEKQSRDRDRDRAQPQPRDGQTTRGNGQISVRQELSSRFPPTWANSTSIGWSQRSLAITAVEAELLCSKACTSARTSGVMCCPLLPLPVGTHVFLYIIFLVQRATSLFAPSTARGDLPGRPLCATASRVTFTPQMWIRKYAKKQNSKIISAS